METKIEQLVNVLKPFAKAANDLDDDQKDGAIIWQTGAAMWITAGDLRRARTALTNHSDLTEGKK